MATDLNSFGNHVSGQISAIVEFFNMADNLRKAKTAKISQKRNEYYRQAAYSAL